MVEVFEKMVMEYNSASLIIAMETMIKGTELNETIERQKEKKELLAEYIMLIAAKYGIALETTYTKLKTAKYDTFVQKIVLNGAELDNLEI